VPGQSPDHLIDLPLDAPAVGRKRGEWQTCAQVLCALRRTALNVPNPTEWPWKQASIFPFACALIVTRPLSRAEMVGGAARGPLFFPGARKPGMTLTTGDGTG